MRRIVSVVVLIAVVIAAAVLTGAGGSSSAKKFKVAFDNAFGLTQGGDLRVGGVRAGETSGFKLSRGPECQNRVTDGPPRYCAIVEAEISAPGFKSFRTDATCAVRQQSLIGEYYVDCQPGNAPRELKNNATIPVTRTQSTVPADLVGNVMRRPYRQRLGLILGELGTGLAGRPDDLAQVLARAHPGLRETQKVLKILGDQSKVIQDFITNSDTVVASLDRRKRDVARWITQAGRTAQIYATRKSAIAAGFHKLPTFLDELRPTMADLGNLIDAQTPLLQSAQRAAPSLTEFLTRLGPFSQASRPAFRSLGHASVVGRKAFIDSSQEIAELRRLAANAPKLGKPLRQFLQTADDRHRNIDNDPRAADSAPTCTPKPGVIKCTRPDPTSNKPTPRRGFTTMETLLNYIYWQTLAVNEFDSISHVLRVAGYVLPSCSDMLNGPDFPGSQSAKGGARPSPTSGCEGAIGPYQPGVSSPDPTNFGAAGSAIKPTAATKAGQQRSAGQPRALPLPGQSDPSVPHVDLPPAVQSLIDRIKHLKPGQKLPPVNIPGLPQQLPNGNNTTPDQMLNFLLSP